MKTILVQEGKVKLIVPSLKKYKLDSKMPVFYNPVMQLNRDVSVILLKALKFKGKALDVMSASGARAIRLKKETKADVTANDINPSARKLIKKNASLNKVALTITGKNAECKFGSAFDYIDVDPFGTPVPYLDAAVKSLKNNGILAVTATDTSNLCGTYPDACMRKYSGRPLRNELMNEIGIRILIKKVQEVGAQYEIALTPIFCHASNHYMRIYLRARQGAGRTDEILKQHGKFQEKFGPIWLGKLWDEELVEKMNKLSKDFSYQAEQLLYQITKEAQIHNIGFFDLHKIAKVKRFKELPKMNEVIYRLIDKGFKASRTHFNANAIKTNASEKDLLKALKSRIKYV